MCLFDKPRIVRAGHIAVLGQRALGLPGHELFVLVILDEGDNSRHARLAVDKAPREAANLDSPVEKQVNIATDTLGMHDTVREHLEVHQLILVLREDIIQPFPVLLLEVLVAVFGVARHPVPDLGIHRMRAFLQFVTCGVL